MHTHKYFPEVLLISLLLTGFNAMAQTSTDSHSMVRKFCDRTGGVNVRSSDRVHHICCYPAKSVCMVSNTRQRYSVEVPSFKVYSGLMQAGKNRQ